MKIVLYVNNALPSIGGREMVVHQLAKALRALGHDVRVLGATGWWRNRRYRFGYPIHRYPMLGKWFPFQLRYFYLLLDTLIFGADVIHAHATYPSGYQATRIGRLLHVPVIITPHGGDINVVPETGHGLRLDPQIAPLIEEALKAADAVTAISDTVMNSILEVIPDSDKIVRIANGFDQERMQTSVDANIFDWLNIAPNTKILLTVGAISPHKGQEVIVRALPAILQRHPDTVLVIAGRHSEKLKPVIDELDLEKQIRLTGEISPPFLSLDDNGGGIDWLAALYQQSTLYVSAGVKDGAEGLSLAVLDAMGAGLPVVATEISGNKDIVRHGVNGLLVEPGSAPHMADAISKLLDDSALCESMGKEARESVRKYQWKAVAEDYISLYRRVCEQKA